MKPGPKRICHCGECRRCKDCEIHAQRYQPKGQEARRSAGVKAARARWGTTPEPAEPTDSELDARATEWLRTIR